MTQEICPSSFLLLPTIALIKVMGASGASVFFLGRDRSAGLWDSAA